MISFKGPYEVAIIDPAGTVQVGDRVEVLKPGTDGFVLGTVTEVTETKIEGTLDNLGRFACRLESHGKSWRLA